MIRKPLHSALVALVLTALVASCARPVPVAESRAAGLGQADRQLVRTGDLEVSVASPEKSTPDVERIVRDAGGYVESSTSTKDANVWLHCRVPADHLDAVMDQIAGLGDEERRSVSVTDVTEQHADLQTRLKNNIALRDRLQQLLARASDVEDVLAIEKELSRIQSEVETMQASLARLEGQVEQSALAVTLRTKQILGPLGYLGYGFWWAFSKLFVIRP